MTSNPEVRAQAWGLLERDSRAYADTFVDTFHPFVQEQLELGRYGSISEDIYNERILQNTDMEKGLIGGDFNFAHSLAHRAFVAGIFGYIPRDVREEILPTEDDIAIEEFENELTGQPAASKKQPGQPYYIEIFTKPELSERLAYWYRLGASNRISGQVEERRIIDEKESKL